MNRIILIISLVSIIALQSCDNQEEIIWVSGIETTCTTGTGVMPCLSISQGKDLDHAQWAPYYDTIEGFRFEKGYLKKLKVKTIPIGNPPADGSSIRYKLIKELEKKKDLRTAIDGHWQLDKINEQPVASGMTPPKMDLILREMRIITTSRCHAYIGDITGLTNHSITIKNIVNTHKICTNNAKDSTYINALQMINAFELNNGNLLFYDKDGHQKLSFVHVEEGIAPAQLHDIWIAATINGRPLDRKYPLPSLNIDLTTMTVFGNDGCNEFSAPLTKITDKQLLLGTFNGPQKKCRGYNPQPFLKVLKTVTNFSLDGLKLNLINDKGETVLTFQKGD